VPATYAKFTEEELRDVLLVHLAPRFEGETSGETFNKGGKTDILIRYEGRNVFVAECLIWNGQAYYLSKISQLLGYLTWRDSKAAIVVFVHNKDFSKVLAAVENAMPRHEQFARLVDRPDSAWTNYVVQLPDDSGREVKVAVLLVHLPK